MHLNIPEVAVFYDRSPYDIIYSHKGYIRGLKSNEQQKMRLKDINRNFKDNWSTKNLPKQ